MEAVSGNQGLFSYRQVKPFDAMIARITLECWIYVGVFICVVGALAWFGMKFIPDDPLMFMFCWFVQVAFGFGLGEISLVLTHGKPNAKTFLRLMVTPLYLLSGILIPLAQFPPSVQYWLMFNPCAHLVEVERVAYYREYTPISGTNLWYPVMWALCTCAVGHVLYRLNRLKLLRR
jgi:capsular polysaccharide transport system permease protein